MEKVFQFPQVLPEREMACTESIWDISEENTESENVYASGKQKENVPEPRWEDVVVSQGGLKPPRLFWRSFYDLNLRDELLIGAIKSGFVSPYRIQGYAFPYLFRQKGENIVIHAPSKSGKTVAALLTILHRITSLDGDFQSLIICPTCDSAEKALDIVRKVATSCPKVSIRLGIRKTAVQNGGKITERIIIGTPSKILDFILKGYLALTKVDIMVLDEAEKVIFSSAHQKDVLQIHEMLHRYQMILLSSSPPNPEIDKFLKNITLSCPITLKFPIVHGCPSGVKRLFVKCHSYQEQLSLLDVVTNSGIRQILVVCSSKDDVIDMTKHLKEKGCNADSLCGKLKKLQRDKVRGQFENRSIEILVTTPSFDDIASSHLKIVVNYCMILSGNELDYSEYDKRMSIFGGCKNGMQINVLSSRWSQCAKDEKGSELDVLTLQRLKAEIAQFRC